MQVFASTVDGSNKFVSELQELWIGKFWFNSDSGPLGSRVLVGLLLFLLGSTCELLADPWCNLMQKNPHISMNLALLPGL